MTLEEIKNAVVAEIEKVWHELTGTVDVDKARQVISDTAATLTSHVSALGQHLFDHVLGNATTVQEAPAVDGEPPVQVGESIPVPTDGSPSAVGIASNPAVEGQPDAEQIGGHAAGDSMPAVDETAPEQSA